MIEVIYYSIISTLLVGCSLCFMLIAYKKSKAKKYIYLSLLFVGIPFVPYVIVEVQTKFYKEEFASPSAAALLAYGDSANIVTMKVLVISPSYADIYVVVPCETLPEHHPAKGYVAYILPLAKNRGHWASETDKTVIQDAVWSDCGSADGNIFPPYAGKDDYR